MTITRQQLIDKRLFDQFATSTTLKELISIFREYVEETDAIFESLALERFMDTAQGVWLDDVAEIVGVFDRPDNELMIEEMFTFRSVSDPDVINAALGYSTLSDPSSGGVYRSLYGNSDGTVANDEALLKSIKAKVYATNRSGSIPDLWDFIFDAFETRTKITTDVGQVYIELYDEAPFLSDFDRRLIVAYAPVVPGTTVTITNWQIQ